MTTVLAFDPGLSITGYAVVDSRSPGVLTLVEAGCIRLGSGKGDGGGGVDSEAARWSPRLVELHRDVSALIERLRPDAAAVEQVFAHREHPRPAIAMAHARGVILLALASGGVPVTELSPASVKKALTGSGRSSKDAIAQAVAQTLGLAALPEPRDVSDAMAIAIAAVHRARVPGGSGG